MPVIKRPVRQGEIFNPKVHIERRKQQAGILERNAGHLKERTVSMPEAMSNKLAEPKPEIRIRYHQPAAEPILELQMRGYKSGPGKDMAQFVDRRKAKRRKE